MKKAIIFLVMFFFYCGFVFAAQLSVYYINVGQGDSEYIELPNGENVLIDGGPNSSTSQTNPLIAFLDLKGISKINHVILSHPHSDHYNGLSAVFDKYTVEKYYDSFLLGSSNAQSFREKAKNEPGIQVINTLTSATTFFWCTNSTPIVQAIMLHRGDAFATTASNANDISLVVKVVFGSSTFIFGGDAAASNYQPIEGWLVSNYSSAVLQSDCYKVNHHGSSSSSSSAFLNVLKPKYAFFEVGPNSYGHPAADVISRLNAAGVKKMYYTGYNPYGSPDGTIQVTTSGDGEYNITPNYIPPVSESDSQQMASTYIMLFDNLFNPDNQQGAEFQYYISHEGNMTVKVYTLDGQLVREEERYDSYPGTYFWAWKGKNKYEETVAAGVYILKIETANDTAVKKAIVMR